MMNTQNKKGTLRRLLAFAAVLALLCALAVPAFAEDVIADSAIQQETVRAADGSTATSTPAPTATSTPEPTTTSTPAPTATLEPQSNADVYVVAETVTDTNGAEISKVNWGDRVNVVLRVVDYSSARFNVGAEEISARVNSSIFTYTGNGEISQLVDASDDKGEYYTYVLLFRDVIYNGGGNTFPINLSYLDSNLAMQQFSVSIGQCVDEDPNDPTKATSPNLVIRQSGYGNSTITAGNPFTLTATVYCTSGTEALNDVIISVTLPENITLSGGSLSSYLGTMNPKTTVDAGFSILPAAGFDKGVANITVNLTGTGALSGKAVTGQTIISVPISQPDRFELGKLDLPETLTVGSAGTVTLNFVNKSKNPVANLEAIISGSNFTSEESDQYLGNQAAGSSNSVDFDVTPTAEGNVSGVITINYEAGDGTAKTLTKNFSLPVTAAEEYDMGDMGDMGGEMEQQPTGMPVWGWLLIGLGVLAALIVAVTAIIKHAKKKKLAQLDEDDDFDSPFVDNTPANTKDADDGKQ